MKVELIKDTQGENNVIHITGIKDSELADIERRLQSPAKLPNFYDRYGATESLNSILNGLMALTSREQRNELKKSQPDLSRIIELKQLGEEVWAINEDNTNFATVERMNELIKKYSPILLAEKKKAQS